MDFPASKNVVKELLPTHPCFDAKKIQKTQDFYEGGDGFNARKKQYLMPRTLDRDPKYLEARLACAKYTREMGRCTDDLVGCILRDPPRITVNNPKDLRAAYWLSLNENIDGYGHSLNWLMQTRFVQTMLHDRAYLTMDWSDTPRAISGVLADDKIAPADAKRARLDIRICYQNADTVGDWETDDDGQLTMMRAHAMKPARGASGVWDSERHVWTFITINETVEYVAVKPSSQTGWKDTDTATKKSDVQHGLDYIPAWLIPAPEGMSFGNGLIDTYDALFNTEAAKAFLIAATALNVPWVKTTLNTKQLTLNELGFLNLGPDGAFGWSAPPDAAFNALKNQCADLRDIAESSIRAMGDKALQTHQSGVAVGISKGPKEVFLSLYRTPVKSAMQRIIDEISMLRNEEDLEPRIVGMDQLGEQAAQLEAVTAQMLLAMPLTLVAKKNLVRQLVATNCDLSESEQEEFETQLAAMTDDDFAPNAPIDSLTNEKTKAPNGLGADQVAQKTSVAA